MSLPTRDPTDPRSTGDEPGLAAQEETRMRRKNTPRRRSPSPLVVMISMGLMVAIIALVMWPKPDKTASLKQKAVRSAMHTSKMQKETPQAAPIPQANTNSSALKGFAGEVRGPLPHSMRRKLGSENARFLAALAARLLIWKVDLRRDLRRGDHIRVLYKPVDNQSKFAIMAMKYHSRRFGKTYHFYRYKEANKTFDAFYDEQGRNVEIQLSNPPLRSYEQVTSILKMRRKHKGVDFKAPIGTKIYLPYRSRIIRQTWNFRYNGNCLEVEFLAGPRPGTRALFLHLDKIMPVSKPGSVLAEGTYIANVGNTGRSTAPHLHYQIQSRSGRVYDPYKFHRTFVRTLPPAEMANFQEHRKQLEQSLQTLTAQ